ncbi:MAG TPA: LysM domain-containing protein [Burkholderiales bacterium]|nr:LysM domain-containing protein [Burkholderiales bacterium]
MVQQMRKSITALAFFLLPALGMAQAPAPALKLKPDAPDRYVVVPGDTLWGIARRYTDSPWRWPELWGQNRDEIRNPHLIYPGNVLVLDRSRGTLAVSSGPGGTVKLSPRTRAEPVSQAAIPSIPPSVIEPFLTRPLVVEPDGMEKAPTIIATQADNVVVATGNLAYVRGISDSTDQTWYLYRRGNPLVDPDSNQTLGYEAVYLGTARTSRPGNPATVTITSAVQEVSAGDKLVAAGPALPVNYAPHAPQSAIKGRVMSIYGGLAGIGEAGPQSIITINRGKADGIEVGHVLAVYARGATVHDRGQPSTAKSAVIQLPEERAGLVFVFRVFDRVSYALVMDITRPIAPLDVVQTP